MSGYFTTEHAVQLLGAGRLSWDDSVVVWLHNQSRRSLKEMAANLMPDVMESRRLRIQGEWDARRLQRGTGVAGGAGLPRRL